MHADCLGNKLNVAVCARIQRGECTFTTKAQNLQQAGATGMVVFNNQFGASLIMSAAQNAPAITIPCLSISRLDGEAVQSMLSAARGSLQISSDISGPDKWQQHLAEFSSKGPTLDGRLVPDIVAPGSMVLSARTGGSCGSTQGYESVVYMAGTSMAAPIVAGGVVLVRQYFEEGWYPVGQKGQGQAHVPSGALLRAMVLNSGRALTGVENELGDASGQRLQLDTNLPTVQQGYGAMNLEAVLHFNPPTSGSAAALFVRDDQGPFATECLNTGDATPFGFRVSAGTQFKVTITWTDPPSDLLADVVLVNDLDLTVLGPNSQQWVGNNISSGGEPAYLTRDRFNNKEQVGLVAPEAGEYTVVVRGHNVPEGPQCYALVVTGDFEEVANAQVACSSDCSLHGVCVNGECVCSGLWYGIDCMRPIPQLKSHTTTATVYPYTWQYFYFDLGVSGSFQVEMQRTSQQGDPDMYIKQEGIPTLLDVSAVCGCTSWQSACPCREESWDGQGWPPVRELRSFGKVSGRVFVGVTAYCCNAAAFTIRVQHTGVESDQNAANVAVTTKISSGTPSPAPAPPPEQKPTIDDSPPPASGYLVSLTLALDLTRADFIEKQDAFKGAMASAANVTVDAVEIIVQEVTGRRNAQLRVEVKIDAKDKLAATGLTAALTSTKIRNELEAAGLPDANIVSPPKISLKSPVGDEFSILPSSVEGEGAVDEGQTQEAEGPSKDASPASGTGGSGRLTHVSLTLMVLMLAIMHLMVVGGRESEL